MKNKDELQKVGLTVYRRRIGRKIEIQPNEASVQVQIAFQSVKYSLGNVKCFMQI